MKRLALLVLLGVAACAGPTDTGDLALRLCDPGSVQLRDVSRSAGGTSGEVNARTPNGGYAGFVPFRVDADGHATLSTAYEWPALCDGEGSV